MKRRPKYANLEALTSKLETANVPTEIPPLEDLNPKSKHYADQLEEGHLACVQEITRSREEIYTVCKEAVSALEILAQQLSETLKVQVTVELTDEKPGSTEQLPGIIYCIEYDDEDSSVLVKALADVQAKLSPYRDRIRALWEDSLPFRARASEFYGALLWQTRIERVNESTVKSESALMYLVREDLTITAIIDTKDGTCKARSISGSANGFGGENIPLLSGSNADGNSRFVDTYVVSNPSEVIGTSDMFGYSVARICDKYLRRSKRSLDFSSGFDVDSALKKNALLRKTFGMRLLDDAEAIAKTLRVKYTL